jgi:hypothetical protein
MRWKRIATEIEEEHHGVFLLRVLRASMVHVQGFRGWPGCIDRSRSPRGRSVMGEVRRRFAALRFSQSPCFHGLAPVTISLGPCGARRSGRHALAWFVVMAGLAGSANTERVPCIAPARKIVVVTLRRDDSLTAEREECIEELPCRGNTVYSVLRTKKCRTARGDYWGDWGRMEMERQRWASPPATR